MKKLLAILLSMIMAVSLAIPAFADEPDGPALEDIIPISGILDGDLGIIGGADGPTVVYPGSIPEADEYLAAHPGLEEQLRANAYDYFDQEYPYYESAQEYMEVWEITEEEFLDEMVEDQLWDLIRAEAEQKAIDWQKEALGGVPGQIGVMVNGQYIPFPDAVPEVTNGRTMVPVRPIIEALDGEAEMVDGKVICSAQGVRLTFTPGSSEVLVEYPGGELPGDGQIFPMDCAPYIKGGRTYVPVRFMGEILGYTVGWDGAYETAVLTDVDALAAEIDENFSIVNRMLANQALDMGEGKNYRVDTKGDMTFTAFDTLNGNTTYTAGLTAKELFNTEAANGTYSFTMSDNAVDALLEQIAGSSWAYADEEDVAQVRAVLEGFKDIEIIMTRKGLMWIHAPALDDHAGQDNVWLGMGLDMAMIESAFDSMGQTMTMGQAYAMSLETDSILSWRSVAITAEAAKLVIGDGCFTTSGGVSTLSWDLDKLLSRMQETLEGTLDEPLDDGELEELKETLSQMYKEYSYTLTVDQKGNAKLSCVLHTLPQHLGDISLRLSMDCSQSADRSSLTMDLHIANVGQLKLTLNASRQATTQQPAVEPPEGSTVVDMSVMPLEP